MSLSMGTYERRFRPAFFIKSSIFRRNRRFSQGRSQVRVPGVPEPLLLFLKRGDLRTPFQGLVFFYNHLVDDNEMPFRPETLECKTSEERSRCLRGRYV